MRKPSKLTQFKVIVLAAVLSAIPLTASAAGLGRITVLSALGQPLRAQLEVTASRDELNSLTAKLASVDAFRVAGIEYVPALSALSFSHDVRETGGRRYIEISTERPLNEPFVDMLVELSWASGRLVRAYTFLLDPPESMQKSAASEVTAPQVGSMPVVSAATREQAITITRPGGSQDAQQGKPPTDAWSGLREASKQASGAARAGDPNRLVKYGDTLTKIAVEALPEGVSLDQMLVALFRNNADAFEGNMNRLRAGKIITLPNAAAGRSIDPKEARKEIRAQAADFNAYRRKLAAMAAAAPAKTEAPGQTAAGKIAPRVEEKLPPAAGKDKLAVSRTEAAKDANGKPLQGRITALEEDVVSRDRALREASSRVAELEKNLTDLKKLAELKSQAGAALQKPAAPVAEPSPPPKPADAVKAQTPPPVAVDATPPVAGAPAPAAPPKPKKKIVPPPPPPEPDFLEENGPMVFGGAGILALLLGYLGFSAYKKKRDRIAEPLPQEPITQASLSANSVFSETGAQTRDTGSIAASEYSVSETVAGVSTEAMDPIVEADTYLAFGRDTQAEEILLDALKAEPARHAVHLKLLEIYSARRSTLQFNTLAKDLYQQTGGSGPEWERAATMGLALDAGNAMYRSKEAAPVVPVVEAIAAAAIDPDATAVFAAQPAMAQAPAAKVKEAEPVTAEPAEEAVAIDFDLDLGDANASVAGAPNKAAPAGPVADESGMEFDLDLGESDTPVPAMAEKEQAPAPDMGIDFPLEEAVQAVEPGPQSTAKPAASEAMALDIDFEFETPSAAAEPTEPDVGLGKKVGAPAADLKLPSGDVKANTGKATVAESPRLEMPPEASKPLSDGIDFDFDLGAAEPTSPMAEAKTSAAASAIDLGSISLDLEAPALDMPVGELAGETKEIAGDNPEAATKLELALAYEEMGDRDGARELLREVVTEGSATQQAAARSRLDQLG